MAVGDRVLASVGLGGFAGRVVVRASTAITLPDGMDAARAATFTQSYSTSLFALRDRAQAAPGETVLVLGAGGGVGLGAIGVARALGCRVLGVASSADKRQAALDAGAEAVLGPAAESLKERRGPGPGVPVSISSWTPSAGPGRAGATGAGRPWPLSGHRIRVGRIPSMPLNQSCCGTARHRHRLGHLGHDAPSGTTGAARRPAGHGGGGTLDPVRPTEYPLDNVSGALEDLLGRRAGGRSRSCPNARPSRSSTVATGARP